MIQVIADGSIVMIVNEKHYRSAVSYLQAIATGRKTAILQNPPIHREPVAFMQAVFL